jgi:DNA-binding LacI/PurR family transcriptional regulator
MSEQNDFTIADVAKAAGVSVSTVSRILNGKQDVAPATRARVQQVIEELGYTPHAQAQRLRAGRTRSIAVVFPINYPGNLPYNPLALDFIIGGAAAAGERGYFFNLITTPATRRSLLNLYRSAQVDGVVLMQIHTHDWRVDLLRQHGYPFVMIGHCADNTGLSFIDLDFEASLMTAFDYLVQMGHRRIGFLSLPAIVREEGYGPAVRAWAGYEAALQKHALDALYAQVGFAEQDIFEGTLHLIDTYPDMTAIVTAHGCLPFSIVRALDQRGRAVPGDCSVIGMVEDRIAELSSPPLTSIDFPSYDMGYRAVDMLIRTLEGELVKPEQILIPPRLAIRNSTGPALETI